MIAQAQEVMSALGVSPDRLWCGNVLDQQSFESPHEGFIPYDCALCIGVLPHIPEGKERALIENMSAVVRPGGLILIEGRNQLFSLFTINRYSHDFFMERLIRPNELVPEAPEEKLALQDQLASLKTMFRTDLPPIRKGHKDKPGYDEIVSRMHNPILFAKQVEAAGFGDVRTLFYHFHCLPPMFGPGVPKLFRKSSLAMEQYPQDWRGYFMASAFIIAAIKT